MLQDNKRSKAVMNQDPSPPAVDHDYLTEAFRRMGVLGAGRVSEVRADDLRSTILSRVGRLHLTYEGPTDTAPASVFLKTGQPERAVERWWGYRHEVEFYSNIAPRLPPGVVPTCYDAQYDEHTREFCLILEDLTVSHKILETPWPLPPTVAESKLCLSAWARFHAAWWDAPELGVAVGQWHDPADPQIDAFAEKFVQFEKTLGERLSPERRDIYHRLIDSGRRLNARQHSHRQMSIVHGDGHPWNMMMPRGEGDHARIFDWDCWRVDVATDDLAYIMSVHWFPDYRRRFECAMLDHYHEELQRCGVRGYDRRALTDDYRLSTLWHVTTPVWQCTGKIPAGIWWNHFDRIFSAVDDLDCVELLG
jgi:hypothetical protein